MRRPAILLRDALFAGLLASGSSAFAQDPPASTSDAPTPTEEAPVETTEEAPVETTEEAPVETTGEAPAVAPEEAPAVAPSAPSTPMDWSDLDELPAKSPATRLEEAVSIYQTGKIHEAQGLLASLANDETYSDPELRQRVRVYLGEVLYRQQDQEAARRVFELVLTADPDFRIDPFRHPPDVCGFFETIRAYIRPSESQSNIRGPIPPLPMIGYMGFGIYQLRHNRPGLGAIMLAGQSVAGVLSAIEFAGLLEDRGYNIDVEGDEASVLRRRAIQWSASGVFYGIWAWSVLDAGKHWRATVAVRPQRQGGETPGRSDPVGLQLRLSGPFR